MKKRTLQILAGAAVAAALGAATVTAVAQEGAPDPFVPKEPTAAVATDLNRQLGVFQREREAGDALPHAVAADFSKRNVTGVNTELSRRALSDGNETLYLVPADGKICAALVRTDQTAATGCREADATARGDVGAGTSVEGDVVTVTGIVPDDVTAVSVALGDGSVKELKPINNAYLGRFTTADQPRTIVYHTADGTREFPVLLPDLAAITKSELQRSAAAR